MIFRKLSTLFLLLFITITAFSQVSQTQSTIYLKDGSFLKGTILEIMEHGDLKLQLFNGSELILDKTLISHVKKDSRKRTILPSGFNLASKGMYFGLNFNFLPANGAHMEWNPKSRRYGGGTHLSVGYRFNRFIGLGAGIGFDGYGDYFVPVFLEVKGSVLKKKISPTYAFQFGYGIPAGGEPDLYGQESVTVEREGGTMIYPSIGVRFETRRNLAFVMDLGVKIQHLTKSRQYAWDWWIDPNIYIDEITYRSLAFRFGLEF